MKKRCSYCGKEFKANHGKQKFCSDKCKVASNRAKKNSVTTHPVVKELINAVDGVTTANKIKPPKKKNQNVVIEIGYRERFLELCELKKINPEDMLAWIEENYGKKQTTNKFVVKKEREREVVDKSEGYNPFKNPAFLKKMKAKED